MPRDIIRPAALIQGRLRAFPVNARVRPPWTKNSIMYDWATIFGNLLLRRGLNYGISRLYIEYHNGSDPIDIPVFGRDEGVSYFDELATSDTNDFLRVPLIHGLLSVGDATLFPGGNVVNFFAQTTGVSGTHGKEFSDTAGSVVIGAALVAAVEDADPTRDLILSRGYFAEANQQAKLPTSQVGLEWELDLQ